jgi:hypothetical protein
VSEREERAVTQGKREAQGEGWRKRDKGKINCSILA